MEQKKESLLVQDEHEHSNLAALKRLQELSSRLIHADDLNTLLMEIMSTAADILQTDKANLQLLNEQTGQLEIVVHRGLSAGYIAHFAKSGCPGACDEAKRIMSRVILEDLSNIDIEKCPDINIILDEGIRAVQCTPLISRGGRLVGMLNNHFSYTHRPSEDDLLFLDLLARMAADLIERKQFEEDLRRSHAEMEKRISERTAELDTKNVELQLRSEQLARLASEITLAEEQERHRLSHVLHDHLQQILVAAKLELSVLARKIGEGEHQPLFDDISGLIDESIKESRNLTIELSPPILHEAGLTAGLQWLARRMQEKYCLDVRLNIAPNTDMKRDDVSILCFQSIRELLFNCVKHSGVKLAEVSVQHSGVRNLLITVTDKGRGFDPDKIWKKNAGLSGGFGLFSIRERLSLLGGSFEIDSKPGNGSVFTLTVPNPAIPSPKDSNTRTPGINMDSFADQGHHIRILLVDDHTVMRRGLASMLRHEEDIQVIGEAQDGQDAIEKVRQLSPDIVLMDYSMPRMNGVEATRHIHKEFPLIGIIGLSMYDEAERSAAMIEVGASAYTSKSEPPEAILSAIRKVYSDMKEARAKKQNTSIRIVADTRDSVSAHRQRVKKIELLQNALFD